MFTGSLSTGDIVGAQATTVLGVLPGWFGLLLFPSFVIYVVSMVGETNRAPFDLPEAESELVGGFHTEYSSLKFALFFLAEYVNMVTVSALATTLFLGGYRAPWSGEFMNTGWWGLLWFIIKTLGFLFIFIWLRGTLPRMRYDQFMRLGWKVLVPVSLVWIMAVAVIRTGAIQQLSTAQRLVALGVVVGLVLLVSFLLPDKKVQDTRGVPLAGGGFPVPPLDLVVPKAAPKRKVKVANLPKDAKGTEVLAATPTAKEAE